MKNLLWFVLGLAGGFVVAHLVNKDPRGHEILAQVDARIGEFTDRMSEAYREQEARFIDVVDETRGASAPPADDSASAATASLPDASRS